MKTVQERIKALKAKKIRLIERINEVLILKDIPTSRLDELTRELRETNLLLIQTHLE